MYFLRSCPLAILFSGALCLAQSSPQVSFTTQHKTVIPGGILKSGNHTIRIVDHLSDRTVVQISSPDKVSEFTFLAVGDPGTGAESIAGPVFWSKGLHGEDTLQGFHFAAGEKLAFVYPKSDAVSLANANKVAVVAVDPASERRPELSHLTPSDLELVTLWSLTPVRVGPDSQKAIAAKRYVAPANTIDIAARSPSSLTDSFRASLPSTQPVQVAALHQPSLPTGVSRRESYVNKLPQTASKVPLVGMFGLLSLFIASYMRVRRIQ